MNIASSLIEQGRLHPHVAALIATRGIASGSPRGERRWSFADLDADSNRLACGLARLGVKRGTRTVVMIPPGMDFYSLTFALFKIGAVVVLIDPGMGIANLGICLAEAEPECFIGISRAHVARVVLGWSRKSLRLFVTSGPRLCWGGVTVEQLRSEKSANEPVLAQTLPDELAAILFTSGSTGVAKGAVYTHGIFTAQVEQLRQLYGIEPGEVDLPTFPLFGLFGPALGMTAILPEMDATRPAQVDPRAILEAVRHYGVTNLFGSPALLRRVAYSQEAQRCELPSLRRVISAGAPVPADVIARFIRMLRPGVQIHTPYGATEALPVASISSEEILGETAAQTAHGKGVCVGRVVPSMEAKIIRISDEPIEQWSDDLELPAGQIGEIVVRGPVVTQSYYNRPSSTAQHKIRAGNDVWHRMGDVGYVDERGRIWFCGRKSQRVNTLAGTLHTINCEGVFNVHPAVFRSALVGVKQQGVIKPVLCVERNPANQGDDSERLARELREMASRHSHTQAIQTFLFHEGFPVDIRHNAKIFREKLAVWAAKHLTRRSVS